LRLGNFKPDRLLVTQVAHDASPSHLNYETSSAIFQVVRELLLNVAKHASTDHAHVAIITGSNTLNVTVTDYGVGFDTAEVLKKHKRSGGFGIFNIRQRIEHLGGSLTIESMPGKGSRATITVPLPSKGKQESI